MLSNECCPGSSTLARIIPVEQTMRESGGLGKTGAKNHVKEDVGEHPATVFYDAGYLRPDST